MSDRTDHRAEAERLLADANEWAAQAGELSSKASERVCLAYAQVHATLAVVDALTKPCDDCAKHDAYAAREAEQRDEHEWPEGFNGYTEHHGWGLLSSEEKQEVIERWFEKQKLSEAEVLAIATQASKRWAHTLDLLKQAEDEERAAKHEHAREAEPDPLDESDHRDRLDGRGVRIRKQPNHWCERAPGCIENPIVPMSLEAWNNYYPPLSFAPEPEPDPLDESDHRDRLDGNGLRVRRKSSGYWVWAGAEEVGGWTLDDIHGPLTFAPEPPPEDSSVLHYYHTNIDRAPDGTAWSWTVAECRCDRPWRHA